MGNKKVTTTRYWQGEMGQWTSSPEPRYFMSTETFERVASDNPKYASLIKQGTDATNDLFVKAQNVHFERGYMSGQWIDSAYFPDRYGRVIETNFFDNFVPSEHTRCPPALFESSVQNRALIGIIKKIRKLETSELAGPTFLGELRETVAMIKSPARSLRTKLGLFTDLHMRILRDKQSRGKRFKPDPWRKVLSDTYLEFVFGARPLILDIAAIADLYLELKAGVLSNGLKRLSFRYSDVTASVEGSSNPAGWSGTGFNVPYNLVEHCRSSYQYVVWIDQSLIFNDVGMGYLSQAAKFDLSEIVPTAWELLPWSFLIDYFTNIGDVLGCTFDYNRNVAFGKVTSFNTVTLYHVPGQPVSVEPDFYVVKDFKPWTYTSQYTEVQRGKLGRLGFPQLDVHLPSVGQIANMAALVSSLSKANPFRGFTLK